VTLPFLEKLLQVLAQGGFSSTYKYAVLLALIDLCVEAGHPPTSVTTAQLARRVVELYWPQVRPYPQAQRVLGQNRGGQATIARLVAEFRQAHPDLVSPPRTGPSAPTGFDLLLDDVEWVLVEYPLPRLQRVGGGEERFIYVIGWGEDVSRAAFARYKRGAGDTFDNRILFQPGAAESLVALASVVRPLVQQQWMVMVRAINGLPEAELDAFLFGAERVALATVQRPLRALQDGRCFYCGDALSGGASQVDHFLPWSRYPDDSLDNLLLAHDRCNREKLHFLADLDFARRWRDRSHEQAAQLDEIAASTRWPRDRARTFGVVASVYQGVPDGVRLWAGGDRLRRVDVADLPEVHGFGRGLLAAGKGAQAAESTAPAPPKYPERASE
jgi:hypothetical protein